eukprot:TRINITY_DN1266_c0_g1_i1.p1 TRINITY_DN1266_c0_g1~~TRINITY_DN1266_c0_g1_i1.p1  ORF type:complete len:288 (-),score=70.99 TRINITY_DN1266_c0_g1_i1:212-1075(-)
MGKKRKKGKDKPFCWYCDRAFNDEKILIQHQKAKHFKCHVCHKKLSTASGMVVHVFQVHKETITKVPNAKPGRDSVKHEIYGMEESAKKKQKVEETQPNPFPGIMPGIPPYGLPIPPTMPGPLKLPTLPPNWKGPPPPIQPSGPLPPPFPLVPSTNNPSGMVPPIPPQGFTIPGGPSVYAPPQQPLFPIQNGASNAVGSVASSSVSVIPGQASFGFPNSTATQKPSLYLVYDDEEFSMEEKRAQLDKYNYSKEKIQAKVDELDRSIESRITSISSIGGLGALSYEDE